MAVVKTAAVPNLIYALKMLWMFSSSMGPEMCFFVALHSIIFYSYSYSSLTNSFEEMRDFSASIYRICV